ncbi:MAG: SAM-dependent methyltransferase [Myxococcales bacterium]
MSQTDFWARVVGETGRRAPGSDELTRRISRLCGLAPGARVLDYGSGTGALARLLAREYGCQLTCVDADPEALQALRRAAAAESVEARIETLEATSPYTVGFEDESFEAVVAEAGLDFISPSFIEAVRSVRRLLSPRGKLVVVTRALVGRTPPAGIDALYARDGAALLTPGGLLAAVEQAGFEPIAAETLGEALVDEHLRQLELGLAHLTDASHAESLRGELELRRRDDGRAAIGTLLLVARRKELGEKPPPARGNG